MLLLTSFLLVQPCFVTDAHQSRNAPLLLLVPSLTSPGALGLSGWALFYGGIQKKESLAEFYAIEPDHRVSLSMGPAQIVGIVAWAFHFVLAGVAFVLVPSLDTTPSLIKPF
jgi:hypothetical protein